MRHARHARRAQTLAAKPISLSFPLGFLAGDLLRLAPSALPGGVAEHRDGIPLLLSALAMAVLAVSSFALRQRLKELR